MELDEMKKLAEERRRQKVEDRLARQKVKEQIARDREQREAGGKDAGGKASVPIPQPAVDVKKNYTACRLQVSPGWLTRSAIFTTLLNRSDWWMAVLRH